MSTSRDEQRKFSKIAELIEGNPRSVDVTESVETFKKKKTLAMVADYMNLYPRLHKAGFRTNAIIQELAVKHNVSRSNFRYYLHKEGISIERLKKLADWKYRKRLKELEEAEKELDRLNELGKTKGFKKGQDEKFNKLAEFITSEKEILMLD